MKKLLPDILSALKAGQRAALAIVLDSFGSAPRKACSAMAVFAGGRSVGTVGGGAVELAVQRICLGEILTAPENALMRTEAYTLLPDGGLRMICGGEMTIFFRTLLPTPEITDVLEKAVRAERDIWLCIETAGGGRIFLMDKSSNASDAALRSRPYYDEERGLLTYPLCPDGFVYIFGGGHVGRALVETLTRIDYECVVYDDREKYSSPMEHPLAARTIHGSYRDIAKHVRLTSADYVIVVTHGHQFDYDVLAETLGSPAKYVGCMGSRRKTAVIKGRLRDEAGIAAADIERLHAPIGLKIGAETPEELAISIAAELIEIRAMG